MATRRSLRSREGQSSFPVARAAGKRNPEVRRFVPRRSKSVSGTRLVEGRSRSWPWNVPETSAQVCLERSPVTDRETGGEAGDIGNVADWLSWAERPGNSSVNCETLMRSESPLAPGSILAGGATDPGRG